METLIKPIQFMKNKILSKLVVFGAMMLLLVTLSNCKKGCTDPEASNYSSKNKRDDGSCTYVPVLESFDYTVVSCSAPYTIEINAQIKSYFMALDLENTVRIYVDDVEQSVLDLGAWNYLNTSIVINSSGTHEVKLKINNEHEEYEYTEMITLDNQYNPVASFTAYGEGYNCLTNGSVDFNNNSAYATSFVWDFGDGATSTLEDPTHYYTSPGTYQVMLTAKCGGGASDTYSGSITVSNMTVDANFSFDAVNSNYHAPADVSFSGYYFSGATYAWYVNNVYVGNYKDLNYEFVNSGTYTIRLDVSCGGSTDSKFYNMTIDPPYSNVVVSSVRFWHPSGYYQSLYFDHYLDGNYTYQSGTYGVSSSSTYAQWNGPTIYNFNNVASSQFFIKDYDGTSSYNVADYYFYPYLLDDDHYPTVVNFSASGNYDFQLILSYH